MGDVSEKIEPALTAEEWRLLAVSNNGEPTTYVSYHGSQPEKYIAEANYRLADADPRKITPADVEKLNALALNYTIDFGDLQKWATRLRDALSSYLPPSEP